MIFHLHTYTRAWHRSLNSLVTSQKPQQKHLKKTVTNSPDCQGVFSQTLLKHWNTETFSLLYQAKPKKEMVEIFILAP